MTDGTVNRSNPLAVGALVLGAVAVVSAVLIRMDVLTFIAGAVAVVLAITGYARSQSLDFSKGRAMSVLGGVAGAFAIVTTITGLWG